MATPDRMLNMLALFTVDQPGWTAEELAEQLGMSVSSTYRYISSLTDAGFLTTESTGIYMLGPAFIEYDRKIRLSDPLLMAAVPVMDEMIKDVSGAAILFLSRVYGETVICVHETVGPGPQSPISYERGRPMPLFRGASSKIILAYIPYRSLRRMYNERRDAIISAGLGTDWSSFIDRLGQMRKSGCSVTREEVDKGRAGIAVPILSADKRILGSLSFVTDASISDVGAAGFVSALQDGVRRILDASRLL